ncbi:MAG: nicotinate-nucleotide adenylyltransferase [Bacteroidota bacterium]
MKRIGIFGGTFDPPHKGHIAIAEQAKKQLGLHCVYFIPAYIPPHKHQHSSTSAQHRVNMMKLAIRGRKEFKISTIELRRRGISYTVDTLKAFKQKFPQAELVFIIGADNMAQFHSWKSPKTILTLASLAVYKRKGFSFSLKESAIEFILLKGRMLRVSSTEIRNRIKIGIPIQALVPNPVVLYIKQHSLYTTLTHVLPQRQFHENHRVF